MNEWGFIGQNSLVVLRKSATINKFKTRSGYVREERLMLLIATHHSITVTCNLSEMKRLLVILLLIPNFIKGQDLSNSVGVITINEKNYSKDNGQIVLNQNIDQYLKWH
jgi:hypothetical protein